MVGVFGGEVWSCEKSGKFGPNRVRKCCGAMDSVAVDDGFVHGIVLGAGEADDFDIELSGACFIFLEEAVEFGADA